MVKLEMIDGEVGDDVEVGTIDVEVGTLSYL
jgi:hypothetical protein